MNLLWRRAPWWIACLAALLALFDVQFSSAGRAITSIAMAIGLAGVLCAPLIDALLLAIAMSLFPGDTLLLGVTLGLLYRVARRGSIRFDGSLRSMLLFGFFVSAAGSALFGMLAVESRPLQWFVWTVTFAAPVVLLGFASPVIPHAATSRIERFLLFIMWLQLPVCISQIARHGTEYADWFAGTWNNSNLVGLWGAITLSILAARLLAAPRAPRGAKLWMRGGGNALAATFLVWGASAKVFCASVFGAAGIVLLMFLIASKSISRIGAVVRVGIGILAIALTALVAESWVQDNVEGFIANLGNSEKQVLLTRVIFGFPERYNSILGVGPGMLGSRAASAASAEVLFKDTGTVVASFLAPAPAPERWAMSNLWDAEVVEGVTNKSALLGMPFSGWGTVRAELGWPAAILLVAYLFSLGWQMVAIAAQHRSIRNIGIAAGIGTVALLPMLLFDNILEQPQIMGPLAILVIVTRGVARSASMDAMTTTVNEQLVVDASLLNKSNLHSSSERGRL